MWLLWESSETKSINTVKWGGNFSDCKVTFISSLHILIHTFLYFLIAFPYDLLYFAKSL